MASSYQPQRAEGIAGLPFLLLAVAAVSAGWVLGARPLFSAWHGFPNTASTTAFMLAAAATSGGSVPARYKWSIVAGLGFSTAGDAFLMSSGDWFVPGLCSFLCAHVCYLWAFTFDSRLGERRGPFVVGGSLAVGLVAWLWPGLPEPIRLPVVLYAVALLAMAAQAASRALSKRSADASLAALGAALFLVSDSVLAYQRFRERLEWGHFIVLGTYFTAQAGIALSVLLYSKRSVADLVSRPAEDRGHLVIDK